MIARGGGRQLHVAETEKYAHVTYFFNGGREREWEGEERRLVHSPRDVATYDQRPEMSAEARRRAFAESWAGDGYRFGIINFANPDMVGHTGVHPRRGRRRGGGRRAASARSSPPFTPRAAPAWSPPTTATRSRCSSRTARPTPPTRPTRSRSSSRSRGSRCADHGILADIAPTASTLLGHRPAGGDDGPLAWSSDRVRPRLRPVRSDPSGFDSRSRRGTEMPEPGACTPRPATVETPAFIPLATRGSVRGADLSGGRGARLRDGARQHLPPAPAPGRGADRRARRPPWVHGLEAGDHHRLGWLPGLLARSRQRRR